MAFGGNVKLGNGTTRAVFTVGVVFLLALNIKGVNAISYTCSKHSACSLVCQGAYSLVERKWLNLKSDLYFSATMVRHSESC